jgi:hypothetical protein
MPMNIKDLWEINTLAGERSRLMGLVRDLNNVNGNPEQYAIPRDVLDFVDTGLAAKGLISLVFERLADTEKKLQSFGVNIS